MIEDGARTDRDTFTRERECAAETQREYQQVDLRLARIERLNHRMRAQEWYHELSDQESEDDIDRMLGDEPRSAPPRCGAQQARVPTTEVERWINRFREEFRNHAIDGNVITAPCQ